MNTFSTPSHAAASSCPPGIRDAHCWDFPVSVCSPCLLNLRFASHPLHPHWHPQGPVLLLLCTLVIPLSVPLVTSKFFLIVKFFYGLSRSLASGTSDPNGRSYASPPLALHGPFPHFTERTTSHLPLDFHTFPPPDPGTHLPNNNYSEKPSPITLSSDTIYSNL